MGVGILGMGYGIPLVLGSGSGENRMVLWVWNGMRLRWFYLMVRVRRSNLFRGVIYDDLRPMLLSLQ